MADKKRCPSCKKDITAAAVACTECGAKLKILTWEIEQEAGERHTYSDVGRIREDLVSGKLKLSVKCRQYADVLERVEGAQREYNRADETEWKTLEDFAENETSLLALYNPEKAYSEEATETTLLLVGGVVAVGWVAIGLIAVGAHPLLAIVLSIILLVVFPTIVGAFIGVLITASVYNIPPLGLALRIIIGYVLGAVIGAASAYTIGRWIGIQIGSRKPKIIKP